MPDYQVRALQLARQTRTAAVIVAVILTLAALAGVAAGIMALVAMHDAATAAAALDPGF